MRRPPCPCHQLQWLALVAVLLSLAAVLQNSARPLDSEFTGAAELPAGYPALCRKAASGVDRSGGSKKVVVVVGAGVAGLAAAERLKNSDCEVVIVEARERMGGRVFTEKIRLKSGQAEIVDWGAQWVHGRTLKLRRRGNVVQNAAEYEKNEVPATEDPGNDGGAAGGGSGEGDSTTMWQPILTLAHELNLELIESAGDETYVGGDEVHLATKYAGPAAPFLADEVHLRSFTMMEEVWSEVTALQSELREMRTDATFASSVREVLGREKYRHRILHDQQDIAEFYRQDLDDQEESPYVPLDLLNWHLAMALNGEIAADGPEVSSFASFTEGYEGGDSIFRDGFSTLVDALARRTGVSVKLRSVVTAIKSPGPRRGTLGVLPAVPTFDEGPAEVSLADGSTIFADAVIVTVPLGVLRGDQACGHGDKLGDKGGPAAEPAAGQITFSPPLSPLKLEALSRAGMGLLEKIVMEFDRAFWNSSTYTFGLVSEDVDGGVWRSPSEGAWSAPEGSAHVLCNFGALRKPKTSSPVLVALAGGAMGGRLGVGKWAKVAASDPEDKALREWAAHITGLKHIFPKEQVLPAKQPRDILELGEPEFPLYFAGEHTSRTMYGTVHGAYWSGVREAARLLGARELFRQAERPGIFMPKVVEERVELQVGQRLGPQQKTLALFAVALMGWLYVSVVHPAAVLRWRERISSIRRQEREN